jgi:hypothetical protein
VRELVSAKRRWSAPPNRENALRGFRGWHERGYLPHRDEPGLIQFVTFRLADSFPEALRSEWAHLWRIEDDRQRRTQLEDYLDKGRGVSWEADYWDTYMRSTAHELQTIRYTENNPTKADLVLDPREWPWGSARLRDAHGRLCL